MDISGTNLDLLRRVLLKIEGRAADWAWFAIDIEDCSTEQVSHHIKLLAHAGYIEARNNSTMHGPCQWMPGPLTARGRAFAKCARNTEDWEQAKAALEVCGGGLAVLGQALVGRGGLPGVSNVVPQTSGLGTPASAEVCSRQ